MKHAGNGRRLALTVLTMAAIAFTGCSKSSSNSGSGDDSNGAKGDGAGGGGGNEKTVYVFGVVAKSQSNPVFQAARKGAEDAAKDLSKEYGVEVKINWRTPNTEDAQQQAQFVEQLSSQGVDGIAISVTDANVLQSAIDGAVDAGVEVACFDSDAPDSKRFVYYGVDDKAAGAAVMRELAKVMGDQGVVAILAGNQAATNLQARVAGVKEELAKHEGFELRGVYYHPETATDAVAKMQSVQTTNTDITGWALVGGWPLYTDNALDGISDTAKVVSMDPLPQPLEYVKKDQVQVLVGQPYHGWGYESIKLLFNKVHFGKSPKSQIITGNMDIVTKDNVADYEGNWANWLGNGG